MSNQEDNKGNDASNNGVVRTSGPTCLVVGNVLDMAGLHKEAAVVRIVGEVATKVTGNPFWKEFCD
jgi:hypothetical protein